MILLGSIALILYSPTATFAYPDQCIYMYSLHGEQITGDTAHLFEMTDIVFIYVAFPMYILLFL